MNSKVSDHEFNSTRISHCLIIFFFFQNTADNCPADTCTSTYHGKNELCVMDYHMCDGNEDCDDGRDELTEEECSKMISNTLL